MDSICSAVSEGSFGAAAVVPSLTVVQPMIYFKNARQAVNAKVSPNPLHWYRGMGALASGLIPSFVLQSAIKGGLAEHVPLAVAAVGAGAISGPLDCAYMAVANYQQVHGGNVVDAVKQIYNTHGSKGFLNASREMAVREGGFTGSVFWLSPFFTHQFEESGVPYASVCGGITAGTVATVVTNGADSRLTRLQRNPKLVETLRETCRWQNWKKGMGWRWGAICAFNICVPKTKSWLEEHLM